MTYEVVSAFIDKRAGRQIEPGEPVPDGLDRDTVERLVAAQCLRRLEPETPAPAPSQSAGDDSAAVSDLFSGGASDGQAGDPEAPDGNAAEAGAPTPAAAAPAGGSAPSARRTRRSAVGGVAS